MVGGIYDRLVSNQKPSYKYCGYVWTFGYKHSQWQLITRWWDFVIAYMKVIAHDFILLVILALGLWFL